MQINFDKWDTCDFEYVKHNMNLGTYLYFFMFKKKIRLKVLNNHRNVSAVWFDVWNPEPKPYYRTYCNAVFFYEHSAIKLKTGIIAQP